LFSKEIIGTCEFDEQIINRCNNYNFYKITNGLKNNFLTQCLTSLNFGSKKLIFELNFIEFELFKNNLINKSSFVILELMVKGTGLEKYFEQFVNLQSTNQIRKHYKEQMFKIPKKINILSNYGLKAIHSKNSKESKYKLMPLKNSRYLLNVLEICTIYEFEESVKNDFYFMCNRKIV
jgi:hypothetical protein